jgi:hypothetical protein
MSAIGFGLELRQYHFQVNMMLLYPSTFKFAYQFLKLSEFVGLRMIFFIHVL